MIISDVGWKANKNGFSFFITCVAHEYELTIHSKDVYGRRSCAIENAHQIIQKFGWQYEEGYK